MAQSTEQKSTAAKPKGQSSNLSLTLLSQAIGATRGALIITDRSQPDDPIIYSNPAFGELTGYDIDEILGHNCRFLQGKDTDPAAINKLRRAVARQREERVTILNYKKDGTPFWNDLLMSPVKNEAGEVTHFIGMQLDITDRIERERQLTASQERLRRANAELEQFTYAASHDLQEPLRMVRSFMQLVEQRYDDKLDEEGRSFIRYAVEGSSRMQTLVNDLLQLSRVRTKGRPGACVELKDAVEAALLNLKLSIDEAEASVDYDAKQLPAVYADETQLIQLLQNLIGNAIKYRHPKRKPHITISAQTEDNLVRVEVADNGIGIDPQYGERIFGIFQRLHTREEYPGTGVGLAICKKIVERQGGQIGVTSTPGKGSQFYFMMPTGREADHVD